MGKMEDWILLQQTDTLLKKAKELSKICDIDVGLILFSPNGALTEFSSGESLEDVYLRYLTQPAEIKGGRIENEENIIQRLIQLKKERQLMKKVTKIQETWEDALETSRTHQEMKEKLSMYNPNLNDLKTVEDVYECEHFITEALKKIQEMKRKKLNDQQIILSGKGKQPTVGSAPQECSSSTGNLKRRNIIRDNDQFNDPINLKGPGSSTSNSQIPDV